MFYVALLGGANEKMFSFYDDMPTDDFNQCWEKLYIKVLILEFEKVKFKKLVDSSFFYGKLSIRPRHKIGDQMYGDCSFGFGNDEKCDSFTGVVKGLVPIL